MLKTIVFAAVLAMPIAAYAQTPNPADPAPSDPKATNGAPTGAPAKGGDKMGSGADAGAMPMKHGKKHHHHKHHHHHHG